MNHTSPFAAMNLNLNSLFCATGSPIAFDNVAGDHFQNLPGTLTPTSNISVPVAFTSGRKYKNTLSTLFTFGQTSLHYIEMTLESCIRCVCSHSTLIHRFYISTTRERFVIPLLSMNDLFWLIWLITY